MDYWLGFDTGRRPGVGPASPCPRQQDQRSSVAVRCRPREFPGGWWCKCTQPCRKVLSFFFDFWNKATDSEGRKQGEGKGFHEGNLKRGQGRRFDAPITNTPGSLFGCALSWGRSGTSLSSRRLEVKDKYTDTEGSPAPFLFRLLGCWTVALECWVIWLSF